MADGVEKPVSPTRKCGGCGKLNTVFRTTIQPYHIDMPNPDDTVRRVIVPSLPCLMCCACHEFALGSDGLRAIDEADAKSKANKQ